MHKSKHEDLGESQSLADLSLGSIVVTAPLDTPPPPVSTVHSRLSFILFSTMHSVSRRRCHFILIVLFLVLTVFISIFLQSLIEVFPALIYRLELGERDKADMKYYAYSADTYINYTRVDRALEGLEDIHSAPRLYKLGYLSTLNRLGGEYTNTDNSDALGMIFFNHEKEKVFNYGDNLISPGEGECLIDYRLARDRGITVGDTLMITYKESMLEGVWIRSFQSQYPSQPSSLEVFTIPWKVVQIVKDYSVRVRTNYRYSLFIDIDTANRHVQKYRDKYIPFQHMLNEYMQAMNYSDHSSLINIRLGSPLSIYYHRDINKMKYEFNRRSSQVSRRLQIREYTINESQPMLDRMVDKEGLLTIVSAMFLVVMVSVILLSGYVISNIFSALILERRKDMATMRMLGMTTLDLTFLYLFQSTLIGVSSIILSIPPLFLSFSILNRTFFGPLTEGYTIEFTVQGIVLGLVFAVAIPFISTLHPLWRVSSSEVIQDLSPHRPPSDMCVHREGMMDALTLANSITAIVFGFCIYILMPLSVLQGNLLFMTLFLICLFIALGIGMNICLMSVQTMFEWIGRLVMIAESKYIRNIVKINTQNHRRFNGPTTIVLVAGISTINIMMMNIVFLKRSEVDTGLRSHGARISLEGNFTLPETTKWFNTNADYSNYSIGLLTYPLENTLDNLDRRVFTRVRTRNAAGLRSVADELIGVTPNYHQVTVYHMGRPQCTDLESITSLKPTEYIYTRFGHGQVIYSAKTKKRLAIDCHQGGKSHPLVKFETLHDSYLRSTRCVCGATDLPGVRINAFLLFDSRRGALVDIPTIYSMLDGTPGLDPHRLMLQKLWISPPQGKSLDLPSASNLVLTFRRAFFNLRWAYTMLDEAESSEATVEVIANSLYYILTLLMYLIFIVNFSFGMADIINSQRKDMGIFNCLGTDPLTVTRVYFYETYTMVIAAGLMSFLLSIVMTTMLGLQMELMIDAVFTLAIPWQAIITSAIFGALLSIISTGLPVFKLVKSNTVNLLRSE
jgi:ABC-type lipoprotein release transport system permease subunit